MKYFENDKLNNLTAELTDSVLGASHRVINGRIEAYTMKRAGNDKKLAYSLGQKYVAEMEEMQQELAESAERRKRSASAATNTEAMVPKKKARPLRVRAVSFDSMLDSPNTTLGDFAELSTRRLMTDLILTLNASFPDYDFSNVKPNQFKKRDIESVRSRIYERLSEWASFKDQKAWLVEMWMAVNDVIGLKECELYSFEEEIEEAALWNFHYFFVNRSMRRIVFFTCSERIDEASRGDMMEEEVKFAPNTEAQLVEDFDWDPSDNVAGGLSLPISI